jgi:hypothetical protein
VFHQKQQSVSVGPEFTSDFLLRHPRERRGEAPSGAGMQRLLEGCPIDEELLSMPDIVIAVRAGDARARQAFKSEESTC